MTSTLLLLLLTTEVERERERWARVKQQLEVGWVRVTCLAVGRKGGRKEAAVVVEAASKAMHDLYVEKEKQGRNHKICQKVRL
jgi:phosphoribosyl-dephospho-CoA transferase